MGTRHQREHERIAATISAQGRRPRRLLPGRTRRHRRQPQRQTKKVTGMESSGGTVLTQRCFRFQETLVSYNQPCCTWNLKAPPLVMDELNRKSTLSSGTAYRFGLFF